MLLLQVIAGMFSGTFYSLTMTFVLTTLLPRNLEQTAATANRP